MRNWIEFKSPMSCRGNKKKEIHSSESSSEGSESNESVTSTSWDSDSTNTSSFITETTDESSSGTKKKKPIRNIKHQTNKNSSKLAESKVESSKNTDNIGEEEDLKKEHKNNESDSVVDDKICVDSKEENEIDGEDECEKESRKRKKLDTEESNEENKKIFFPVSNVDQDPLKKSEGNQLFSEVGDSKEKNLKKPGFLANKISSKEENIKGKKETYTHFLKSCSLMYLDENEWIFMDDGTLHIVKGVFIFVRAQIQSIIVKVSCRDIELTQKGNTIEFKAPAQEPKDDDGFKTIERDYRMVFSSPEVVQEVVDEFKKFKPSSI